MYWNDLIKDYDYLSGRPIQYSLKRKDLTDFIKRLRSRIDYYYKKHNLKSVDLCRKDFKYFACGEYGDCFKRPHYHVVFFGLDYNFCKDIFEECWQNGIIDSLPVKAGCFEYVTKYLTKQVKGSQAKEIFDDNYLERPFSCHSLGLGKGIILDNFDFIRSHNLCYLTDNNKLRPIPHYYARYFLIRTFKSFGKTSDQMLQAGIKPDFDILPYYHDHTSYIRYSLKRMNDFRHSQSLLRHEHLRKSLENKGIFPDPLLSSFDCSDVYVQSLVDSIDFELVRYGDKVPF